MYLSQFTQWWRNGKYLTGAWALMAFMLWQTFSPKVRILMAFSE